MEMERQNIPTHILSINYAQKRQKEEQDEGIAAKKGLDVLGKVRDI